MPAVGRVLTLERQQRDLSGNPAGPDGAQAHLDVLDQATEVVAAGQIVPDAAMPVRDFFRRALRDPAVEAAGENAARNITGNTTGGGTTRVFTPAGRAVDVEPQVVELRDLIPSHTNDFTPNPAYPHAEGVQPRERGRNASAAQVRDIVANLEPERLGTSPEAGQGSPIIDEPGQPFAHFCVV
ncbi:hypothetical protein [Roseomonas sp. BN140053]|uniref:hypothetical protein n=1 Tax=Roseomonas sp. BN140053 TaxID=3391898 RepID=UPI0039ECD53D